MRHRPDDLPVLNDRAAAHSLNNTGGIIQGMSGSPIIQNGLPLIP